MDVTSKNGKSISYWQQEVAELTNEYNLEADVEYRLLDMMSELGEVSKELLIMTNYGQEEAQDSTDFAEELGDLLFSLITVANTMDIDLQQVLDQVLDKYQQRFHQKGHIGSQD